MHLNKFNLYCDICNRGFNFNFHLELHRKKDHEGMKYVCGICKKELKDYGGYKIHLQNHDRENLKKFSCPVCDEEFRYRHCFTRHLKVHKGEIVPFVCHICGKAVSTKVSLREHMLLHSDERPHKCDICGKCFNKKAILITHTRLHTGEKPFVCTICSKSFRQKPALNVHMKYHTRENMHECLVCQKKYVTKYMLKTHNCSGPSIVS